MTKLNRCHGAKKKICVTTLEVRVMGLFMKAPAAIKFQYGFQMLKIKGQVLTQAQVRFWHLKKSLLTGRGCFGVIDCRGLGKQQ